MPHLTQNGKKIDCNISNYVPFVVPGLSASSSSTTPSPTSSSSSQDSVFDVNRYTETRYINQQKLKNNNNEGRQRVQSDLLHDLLDWLQEFRENLVIECNPLEPQGNPAPKDQDTSSSHELPMEPRAKVELGSGEHGVYALSRNHPNCDI